MYDYDAIIIGAGIGGLFSAAFLLQAGYKVALVEKHVIPGGYCTGFKRKQYYFDSVAHFINGCGEGGIVYTLLEKLGIVDRFRFHLTDPMTTLVFPEWTVPIQQDYREFIAVLQDLFPHEKQAIADFFQLLLAFYHEANRSFFGETFGIQPQSDLFFQYYRKTFAELLDEFFTDEQLKTVLNGQLCYSGLPASQVSAIWMGIQFITHHVSGSYYPEGGMQKFADEMLRFVKEKGGDVFFREEVNQILVKDGKTCGVQSRSGQTWTAPIVISNGNVRDTLLHFLPEEYSKPFERRIGRLQPSISAFCVYLGAKMDLASMGYNGSNYLIHENPDYEETSRVYASGRMPEQWSIFLSVPTLKLPGLNPNPLLHSLSIITLAPYHLQGGWATQKEYYRDQIIQKVCDFIPGLDEQIEVVEAATPLTLERYTHNWDGAAYGLAMTPGQALFQRPINKTPIEGLYLTGHYTFPGLGILSAARSGYMTAEQVIKDSEKHRRLSCDA